jgi:hypothetical protein
MLLDAQTRLNRHNYARTAGIAEPSPTFAPIFTDSGPIGCASSHLYVETTRYSFFVSLVTRGDYYFKVFY